MTKRRPIRTLEESYRRYAAFWLVVLPAAILLAIAVEATDVPSADDRRKVDLIAEGDWLLTMVDGAEPVRSGAVAIKGGAIVAAGPASGIHEEFDASRILDGEGKILMPGLINGHTHAAMTLFRGIGNDLNLNEWLQTVVFPMEAEFVDDEFVRIGTELACWEMLRGGTTTFVDMYFFPNAVAETVESCGARAIVVPTVMDQKSPDAVSGSQSLQNAIQFANDWSGRSSRVYPAIGGHAIYTLKEPTIVAIREAALNHGVPVGIHVSESLPEMSYSNSAYGMSPVQKLEELGLFDATVIAAHVVHADDADIGILGRSDVGVIHNPTSNMKLASGIAPVARYVEEGVTVGLGTDGPASNNDLNVWEEMRLASFLQKVASGDATALPALTSIAMATREGARAIGLGETIGQLRAGYRADLIQVSIASIDHMPVYEPYAHLAYVTDEKDVTTVIVDGSIVVENGRPTRIDEDSLRRATSVRKANIAAWLERRKAN